MRTILKPPLKMSATLALNTRVSELRAQGHHVYHMGFGESKFPVQPKVLAAFHEHATARSYLPIAGLPELRQNVADFYRRHFKLDTDASRIIVGSGSKTMLYAAMHTLEGDVLLPAPTWVSYDTQAELSGKAVTWMTTKLENNYCLTPDELEAGLKTARAAGQAPGILVLTSPGNPTGSVYPPQLLQALTDIARREGLVVISDEIYALTTFGDVPFVSAAYYYPEGTIVTGGLSKHLSLGGWRLGVAVMPTGEFGRQLYQFMTALAGAVWTTASAPVQYAAVTAYANDPEIDAYAATCTTIHGYVTTYLYKALHALGVPSSNPGGGFYVYPTFAPWREALAQKFNVRTSQELAQFLLNEYHIATLPGDDFGADPLDLTLRLSTSYLYALTDADGEAMLATFARQLPLEQFLQETCPNLLLAADKFKEFIGLLEK